MISVKNIRRRIKSVIKEKINSLLKKYGYVGIDEFHRPYIIQKSTEGVDFLFHIKDKHSRLWYDLYSTDPVWLEMRFIRDNLINPKGGVVIECGAHHGATTIMLSHWVGAEGKVYAYEPGKVNYGILVENIKLNAIKNIFPIQAAVGAEEGEVQFDEFPDESMSSNIRTHHSSTSSSWQALRSPACHSSSVQSYPVKQVSLNSHALERPTLIKIDTQGYVYQPLLGLKNIIREQRPNLSLEIDGIRAISKYGDNFYKIFEIIEHEDYDYFVAFKADEFPRKVALNEVIKLWKTINNLARDIHLFAKNRKVM